jgi:glucokinase
VIKNPDLHFGMNNELQSIMAERSFSMKGYALIYMTLGGRDISNFSNISTIEQAQIYGIVMTLLQTEDSKFQAGKLTSRYLTALGKSSSDIPR